MKAFLDVGSWKAGAGIRKKLMNQITPSKEQINQFFTGHWRDFYSRFVEIKRSVGKYSRSLCPFHEESDPSFSTNTDTGLFRCFGCKETGDAFSFYGKLKGLSSFPAILQGIASEFGLSSSDKPSNKNSIVVTYDYQDEKGDLLFQVCRCEGKQFKQRRPDGSGGWIWKLDGERRVLYHLPEILKADQVLIPEGEKDVDNLRQRGFTATTNPGGAGNWRPEFSECLRDKEVILLPDNDEPGRKHIQVVGSSLHGVARSIKVVELPGLPDKGDVSDWIEAGGTKEDLLKLIESALTWEKTEEESASTEAKKQYPRKAFPWEVLPGPVCQSLQQLARSCASSPTSLPGAATAIFSSLIGTAVSVSPKKSWTEPLIFWSCDIRPSGSGKTPAARSLCQVLYDAQIKEDETYKRDLEMWESLAKRDRGTPPPRPRGYFVTNLTLEGLRSDHSGHGGKVCILDELSSFLSSQNEYKAKGSDRESWLCLHDGKPARIVRAKEAITLSGSRISIFGGVQPGIWKKAFGEEGEVYLLDGTIFRFLPTYEGEAFFPLTSEAWTDQNREVWESLLEAAMRWSDKYHREGRKLDLLLSSEAQSLFLDWRNDFVMRSNDLPDQVKGFIPKLVGYALRWCGVLFLMKEFTEGREPGSILQLEDIRKGTKVSEFYLGHILVAMEAIQGPIPNVVEATDQVVHLARTMRSLEPDLDNGRLAIGYIQEKFNESCDQGLKIRSPHLMGSLLRRCGLTITGGRYKANGRAGVFCLVWDKKTTEFLGSCPFTPISP
jgi:hypothetical protein